MQPKLPRLNKNQLDRLSEVTGNLSVVFMSSMVIPVLFNQTALNHLTVVSGLGLAVISLILSLLFIKGGIHQ